ncbi:MAG: hypothetical protein V4582_06715 [Pseudomonadota bacterium]
MVSVRRYARQPYGVLPVSATGRAPMALAAALRRQSGKNKTTINNIAERTVLRPRFSVLKKQGLRKY